MRAVLTFGALLVVACTGRIAARDAVEDVSDPVAGGAGGSRGTGGAAGLGAGGAPPATCRATDIGWSPLRTLTAREYGRTLRAVFAGAKVPADSFPPEGERTALDPSARTLDEMDDDVAAVAAAALADVPAWLGCSLRDAGADACRDRLIAQLGRLMTRRPLADEDARELRTLYDDLRSKDGFSPEEAAAVVLRALAQTPEFLYHLELGPSPSAATPTYALTAYERASRLSYFLWQSMPDAALFDAAEKGRLDEEAGLAAEITRLLGDERATETIVDRVEAWFGTDELDHINKSATVYPGWNDALEAAMRNETRSFVRGLLAEPKATVAALLSSDHTVAGPEIAALYGVPFEGTVAKRIALPVEQRAGMLTHPSVMTVHGGTSGSHPVKRGLLVRSRLLCQAVPAPPLDVDTTINPDSYVPGATTREIYAVHLRAPTCAACHRLTDPIGLAFEHYDGIGRFREREGQKPVDATGELTQTDVDGPVDGAVQLADKLAQSRMLDACFATRLYEAAVARTGSPEDACHVEALGRWLAQGERSIADIVARVMTEPSLRHRRRDALGRTP